MLDNIVDVGKANELHQKDSENSRAGQGRDKKVKHSIYKQKTKHFEHQPKISNMNPTTWMILLSRDQCEQKMEDAGEGGWRDKKHQRHKRIVAGMNTTEKRKWNLVTQQFAFTAMSAHSISLKNHDPSTLDLHRLWSPWAKSPVALCRDSAYPTMHNLRQRGCQ